MRARFEWRHQERLPLAFRAREKLTRPSWRGKRVVGRMENEEGIAHVIQQRASGLRVEGPERLVELTKEAKRTS